MINLREKDRARVCQIAQQTLCSGSELWAYGSRVKGTNRPYSDLDLALITPENGQNDIAEFKHALQHSNIPIFVQVMPWELIPESFKDNILQRYEVLCTVA
ncbi:nucleotidyltransferase domain-containing protein [Vibrio sp. SCSIO 43136]|uniref:nucleotidyltransferase family protein n=1 Tax=Vibrio sp. SCSIO 43136 TaxID=2819101 RepID=UPI0020762DA8|nr:nucleotidyltransferase domain-containing protein [Vibrio sp. SCSIO 43136]USD65094.1 nucleotidyltransferase domain-containing protein [Vibrio sp. SCSIO 43136]